MSSLNQTDNQDKFLINVIRRHETVGSTVEEVKLFFPFTQWVRYALRDGWVHCPGHDSPMRCELIKPGSGYIFATVELTPVNEGNPRIILTHAKGGQEVLSGFPVYPPNEPTV